MPIQHAETILLESSEELASEPSEESFSKVTAQLLQVQKWKHFGLASRILENRFLFVKKHQNGKTQTYWVNLLFVNPQPKRERKINGLWGLSTLLFSALTAGLVFAERHYHISTKFVYFNSVTFVLAILAALSFAAIIYTAKNNVLFTTLNGRAPVVAFVNNNPSRQEFKTYIKNLKLCIEKIQAKNAHKANDWLANELGETRRLKDEKVISDKDYERAKRRILSRQGFNPTKK